MLIPDIRRVYDRYGIRMPKAAGNRITHQAA
jgi:hypothetical protein